MRWVRCGALAPHLTVSAERASGLFVLPRLVELGGPSGVVVGLERARSFTLLLGVVLEGGLEEVLCPLTVVRRVACQLNHFLVL